MNWHHRVVLNTSFADLRTWAVCWAVYSTACTVAVAATAPCMPEALRAITFEHVPTDIDAPVIVEASIQDATVLSDDGVSRMVVMNARIDRVIKGAIDAKTLKIVVDAKRCTRAGIGHGIVLGRLQDHPVHGAMLEPVQDAKMLAWSKEFAQKQRDLLNSAICVKNGMPPATAALRRS